MFWEAHDKAKTSAHPLSVWGIWINPETEDAEYEVISITTSTAQLIQKLPEFPDEVSFMVQRNASGAFSARIMSPHSGAAGT
jgi:hypothetical protein